MSRYHSPATLVSAFVAGLVAAALLGAPSAVTAATKSDEAKALERIARAIETRCKP